MRLVGVPCLRCTSVLACVFVPCRTDGALAELGIKSVSDLAKWKYAKWAQALAVLAAYERAEGGSR